MSLISPNFDDTVSRSFFPNFGQGPYPKLLGKPWFHMFLVFTVCAKVHRFHILNIACACIPIMEDEIRANIA